MSILCGCIETHEIAWHQLEVFKTKYVRVIGSFLAGRFRQVHVAVRSSIYGVMQPNIVQSELVRGLNTDGNFFDGVGAVITARTVNGYLGRHCFFGSDKVVLRESDRLAA